MRSSLEISSYTNLSFYDSAQGYNLFYRLLICPVGLNEGFRMPRDVEADRIMGIFQGTIASLIRRDGKDLSVRQLGVFLTCYLREGPHTVRGLATGLNVSKPVITRALDRLGEFELASRKIDPADRRSVLVQKTIKGQAFLRDLRALMGEAAAEVTISDRSNASPRLQAGVKSAHV